MKRGTPQHPKVQELAKFLGIPIPYAVGILEILWHETAKYAIQGNIGKWDNKRIAKSIGWPGNPDRLIDALMKAGWLDEDPDYRLVVHDWEDHADQSVRKTLKNRGLDFIKPGRIHTVYFIRSIESRRIKIGTTSRSVEFRLGELKAMSPEPLELIGQVPGSFGLEDQIHRKFKHAKRNGEWFEPLPELENYLLMLLDLSKTFPEKFGTVRDAIRKDPEESGIVPPQPQPVPEPVPEPQPQAVARRKETLTDYPKTEAAVLGKFQTADVPVVLAIVDAAVQAHMSVDNPKMPLPDDDTIAEAVEVAYRETKAKQNSVMLFTKTVPTVISGWARRGHQTQIPALPANSRQQLALDEMKRRLVRDGRL